MRFCAGAGEGGVEALIVILLAIVIDYDPETAAPGSPRPRTAWKPSLQTDQALSVAPGRPDPRAVQGESTE